MKKKLQQPSLTQLIVVTAVAVAFVAYWLTRKDEAALSPEDLKKCEMLDFICRNVQTITKALEAQSGLSSSNWGKISKEGQVALREAFNYCATQLPHFFNCQGAGTLQNLSKADHAAVGFAVLLENAKCGKN